jgi:hypothetical protein
MNLGGIDLEDVGETVLDQCQHCGTVHRGLLDVGLCGHVCSPQEGDDGRMVVPTELVRL